MQSKPDFRWLFIMAWRDSRKNLNRLLLFISSIVIGIAALVAINSFGENLRQDIDLQAKELLGADLLLAVPQKPDAKIQKLIDSLAGLSLQKAEEINFASMIYFPKNKGTRLVQVRALSGAYPFYGTIETSPSEANVTFRKSRKSLLDQTLLLQFNAQRGDSVRIGKLSFLIEGKVQKAPGQTGIVSTIAPRVYIPMQYLEQSGLIQKGSRFLYQYYFQFDTNFDVEELVKKLEKRFRKESIRYDTVERRKESLGSAFEDLTRFLNLVAFVALLLGCVGVASAVQVYIREKINTIALLRCIGAKSRQAFLIYLIQIMGMGLLGSILGAFLGAFVQLLLPEVFKNFLPMEVHSSLSWKALTEGILIGLGISLLFAILPLLSIRKISPLLTLRASFETPQRKRDILTWLVYLIIILFVFGFAYLQIGEWRESAYFTGSLVLAFLVLWTSAKLLMWLVKRFFPVSWNYIWRQSLANLYRPNNQTLILIISIGLGTALISTLYFIQNMLVSQVSLSDEKNQANMILFDIQSPQKEKVAELTRKFKLPVLQEVPIVTTRIAEYKGKSRTQLLSDTGDKRIPTDVLNREYRVTYRDTLANNEKLIKGKLSKEVKSTTDSIFISMEEFHARRMKARIGDEIVFNVQGTLIKTYLGSIRRINFNSFQTSFTIVFPKGVLEEAPQFHVLITRINSKETSAKFQESLVRQYPNVSIIDISLILDTIEEVLDQIAFVIRFMALFSILTGILVLVASVIISKFQRIQESVLLRTLGASRRQIFYITALEYFFLGSLASLTGILLSLVGTWALAKYSFKINFNPDYSPIIWVYLIITGLTVFIGLLNSRGLLNRPPLEVLRNEV